MRELRNLLGANLFTTSHPVIGSIVFTALLILTRGVVLITNGIYQLYTITIVKSPLSAC